MADFRENSLNQASIVRLTQSSQKTGCAAKLPAEELRDILKKVKFTNTDKNLLIDASNFDDAAIYKINDNLALVQTLDFFTPIVDSPYEFGAIAATNALSDVYAMGGIPTTAMGILAFPVGRLDNSVIAEVLQGAAHCVERAGASMVGGHSIDDESLKFGLSVTGFVHPNKIWSNQGAKPGDKLILTKPLGAGTLTTALKRGALSPVEIQDAIESMKTLNNVPSLISAQLLEGINAATDITGFALSGHSLQMARASQVGIRYSMHTIPRFAQTMRSLEMGHITKAHRTNDKYTADHLLAPTLTPGEKLLIHDPQTSGGLLLSVNPNYADELLVELKAHFPGSSLIGEVFSSENPILEFTP